MVRRLDVEEMREGSLVTLRTAHVPRFAAQSFTRRDGSTRQAHTMSNADRYMARGVSASKEDVHAAIANVRGSAPSAALRSLAESTCSAQSRQGRATRAARDAAWRRSCGACLMTCARIVAVSVGRRERPNEGV